MVDENGLPAGFGEVDPDFQREAYEESKKIRDGGDGKTLFLKAGMTHLRILPPVKGAKSWFRAYKEHGLRTDGKYGTVTCPTSIDDSECPICEVGKELYEAKGDINIKKAKKLYAKQAYLYNACVYSSPDGKTLADGIFVVKSGSMVFKQFMEFDNDPAGDWGDISNITNGVELRVTRTGKGRFDTEYSVMGVPTRSNIVDQVAAKGVDFGEPTDLTEIYPPLSYDELADVYAKSDNATQEAVVE
ncbi:hypothetical protein LCGC14_0208420 [marine sediment metagenome]|uniref:Bacteriophage T4 Gp32 single-stranded DNA-binding domain-containing protein n=1 Tax=marine sediment metagenome TaxID=412755 RepID=A0A0F9X0R3_9ZZZZ